MNSADTWLQVTPKGLYCAPGDFYIDPTHRVERAVVTHAHADHARYGNHSVLATPNTLDIMKIRYGESAYVQRQELDYGKSLKVGDVTVTLFPAGHVLGSAQVLMDYKGERVIAAGDYKRRPDPSTQACELIKCHVFITEATFALPVFTHPPAEQEIAKLLAALRQFPDRVTVVGAYSLGKAQRVMAELKAAGYNAPIYMHGAIKKISDYYLDQGWPLGELIPASQVSKDQLKGQVLIAPPSALADKWSASLPDPLTAMASGWMRVRARAKQRGVELPLVISDHVDWPELVETIQDVEADEIWITHGREDALMRQCELMGIASRPLRLIGYEDEDSD